MGSVNDVAQMCPVMKFHKWTGNHFLKKFGGRDNFLLMVPSELKKDLMIIVKMVDSSRHGLPIARQPALPTLSAVKFYTDAAGVSFSLHKGKRFCHDNSGRGISCIGGEDEDSVWGWTRLSWPEEFLTTMRNENGVFWTQIHNTGKHWCASAITRVSKGVIGRNIIIMIDNMAVVYGWPKGLVKNDKTAIEVLKAAHYLASFLGVTNYSC